MHVVVVANGDLPAPANSHELSELLSGADLVVAADGGLAHCVELGHWPDVLIGDLDSASPDHVERARSGGSTVIEHPADKDATDLELALSHAAQVGATKITVVAAFGGRLDHELATIALLASNDWPAVSISAVDGRRQLFVVRSAIDLTLAVGATVSLLPWAGQVTAVTTAGLQWPLSQATLALGSTLGVSNVVVEVTQSVSISSGTLLVVSDKDNAAK